jgi:hypothetical protein
MTGVGNLADFQALDLESHSWEEYDRWHLIACQYRAAEWRHKEIELAAHDLLQYLDNKTA